MSNTTLNEAEPSLADRLNRPETQAMLHRLLDRAEDLERILAVTSELPNLLAVATDLFDAFAADARKRGINLEQRGSQLLDLFEQVTQPENLKALQQLSTCLPQLAQAGQLAASSPDLLATVTDIFDEWARNVKADGIDLEESVRNGLYAALYLGGQIRRDEIDRLGYLLRSDVLSEHSVTAVGLAGSALSSCQQGTCEHPVPERVGVLGLLAAARDPNTQRALSFAVRFGKCFGRLLEERHPETASSAASASSTREES
ncbi:DUF1641 domain-containing protein [Rubinisphaera sp. JC750]|uniref:DUF1641 domain-containing protein n=1 Tax=Rubinisphaera sp. JC750 TaxID=2898658 RepID=UPI001F3D154E|nr:DUF1641 domain-containing protein [Rubinisphaera sp. JC750]